MKRIFLKVLILTVLLMGMSMPVYATTSVHSSHSTHVTHSTPHTTTHSSTSHSTTSKSRTITGAKSYSTPKTYTAPKSYTSKYNSSNIRTQTTNTNPNYFHSYSTTNMFRPNFWTAMWAFNCMKDNGNDNSKEVSEQDIAKELEERGYSQDEIKEILKEGENAKTEEDKENKKRNIIGSVILVISIIIFIVLCVVIPYIFL